MSVDPTRFLTQAVVRLFGWVVGEVTWTVPDDAPKDPIPGNVPVPGQGGEALTADMRKLAHVLAFSNEGRYTPFRTPALFLVSTDGHKVWEGNKVDPARLGLAQLDQSMVFASNLRFWTYDRSAYITRLDMSSGTLQRVVIDLETGSAQGRRIDLVGQEGSYTARLGQGHY
jgi:hypothetical protein